MPEQFETKVPEQTVEDLTNGAIIRTAESSSSVATRITVGGSGSPEHGYDSNAALARAQAASARVLAEFDARPPRAVPGT